MAVNMNSIGNYSAYGLNQTKSSRANVKNGESSKAENINNDEKKYFAEKN